VFFVICLFDVGVVVIECESLFDYCLLVVGGVVREVEVNVVLVFFWVVCGGELQWVVYLVGGFDE